LGKFVLQCNSRKVMPLEMLNASSTCSPRSKPRRVSLAMTKRASIRSILTKPQAIINVPVAGTAIYSFFQQSFCCALMP